MNYLAHLYLADDRPLSLIGNLMGDFHKGAVDANLPEDIRLGILRHRRIDSFTDSHTLFKRSRGRLSGPHRRYAGILIDMFYDHFLATHWEVYSDVPLDDFAARVYSIVRQNRSQLPARMQRSMHYLVETDLLRSYRNIDGIDRALKGIATRLTRPSPLGQAITELERNYQFLEADFSEFFPELVRFAATRPETAPDVA
ncbi:acyl carrier protein phosphodiesterase [Luminiphilus syltensis NOR5-1B]|uniref:Acyl carrier protein phosphodiesterase n=1 Tax=Luminiphilus syltensis NOR5-1B TaxID=565045 RepID=B8KQR8_9GAMM|nr:ACP phosphodiesterase [Luminiphilus syltensis]EED36580.1 acyl carrier protein phosphodiesterase [Luminiphilus syltensis NOR5-1B]